MQVSLHSEPPKVGLVKKLTGCLYWWVVQCLPTLHREVFSGHQKLTSAMKLRSEVMVDFKFDGLYR